MGSSVSQPQAWTPALCSDDRIIFSLRNPSYASLWSYPYFDLVALTSKCYRFLLRCTILQQLKTAEETQEKTEETKNLLEQLVSAIFEVVNSLTGVKISNLHVLDITFEKTPDCKGAIVKIPTTAEVNVNLPVLGEIVDLGLNLVLQFCVGVETDEDTGDSKVVVEECRSDQHSISLSVLGRRIGLLNEVVDFAVNLVNEALSLVTHYELCPLVHSFLESLDAEYVKNHIDELHEIPETK
nr:short palate, lung and nasal epithelium carcinoma-associated protein 2A-like [Odocoileus virginianus texanus]